MATASAYPQAGYRHDALTYAGEDDFVRFAAAFLGMGLEEDEPGILITTPKRLVAVRDSLGSAARQITFADTAGEVRNPAVALSVLQNFTEASGGRRVRGIGDLVHPGQLPAAAVETQLHELMLNTPVTDSWNMWLTCPYDRSVLGEDEIEQVALCHPGHHTDLSNLVAEKFGAELPKRPEDAETFPVELSELGSLRAIVRTAATMSGLDDERADEFVYAVNEVISNSFRHGDGKAEVALWAEGESLVCEVQDGGHIVDPLTGRIPPSLTRSSGRGLWMVNHLCDLVQVRSPESGTYVRMFVAPN
ncbi:MAG TPA: sensor histidine kinase [Jatrophihabitans sp.]|jgi:anti-sigma regulatory factor (Ser/Thr protein kinase)